jgi:hypothetical protein
MVLYTVSFDIRKWACHCDWLLSLMYCTEVDCNFWWIRTWDCTMKLADARHWNSCGEYSVRNYGTAPIRQRGRKQSPISQASVTPAHSVSSAQRMYNVPYRFSLARSCWLWILLIKLLENPPSQLNDIWEGIQDWWHVLNNHSQKVQHVMVSFGWIPCTPWRWQAQRRCGCRIPCIAFCAAPPFVAILIVFTSGFAEITPRTLLPLIHVLTLFMATHSDLAPHECFAHCGLKRKQAVNITVIHFYFLQHTLHDTHTVNITISSTVHISCTAWYTHC